MFWGEGYLKRQMMEAERGDDSRQLGRLGVKQYLPKPQVAPASFARGYSEFFV